MTLTPRSVVRAGVQVSPIIWEVPPGLASGGGGGDALIAACVRQRADWFFLPAELELDAVERFGRAASQGGGATPHVLVGMHADHLLPRGSPAARRRLQAAGEARPRGVLLEGVAAVELKGGRVFQRMTLLRDEGLVQFLALDAADVAAAEWMVEHTPAHAVCVPFGLADQAAAYALLSTAEELATAVFARRPARSVWTPPEAITPGLDLSFRAESPRVTASIEPLPASLAEVEARIRATSAPMSVEAREGWWSAFQQQVQAPPKSRGGHPPEFGA